MTERLRAGHYSQEPPTQGNDNSVASSNDAAPKSAAANNGLTIEALYEANFDFVWRSLKHLGVVDAAIDDAVQDTFVVAHRRLADFAERSSPRTWLFGIAMRVARDQRRARGRRERFLLAFGQKPEATIPTPYDHTVAAEAGRLLRRFLDTLSEEQRAVFVMADLEQMTAPEIAEALGVNLNTVYSRMRAARAAFNAVVAAVANQDDGGRHG